MAKKRKRKKEEKYEFKIPEFDEEEFLHKEIRNARTTIITIIYAIPIAIASLGLTLLNLASLGAILGIIGLASLKYMYPLLNIDTTLFEKKNWLGNGALFFFTWLAVWVMICNPPFYDLANPTIDNVEIWVEKTPGSWTKMNETNELSLINIGENVNISAIITDNHGLESIMIFVTEPDNNIISDYMSKRTDNVYEYTQSYDQHGTYSFTIKAIDSSGNEKTYDGEFYIR